MQIGGAAYASALGVRSPSEEPAMKGGGSGSQHRQSRLEKARPAAHSPHVHPLKSGIGWGGELAPLTGGREPRIPLARWTPAPRPDPCRLLHGHILAP
jgi:hypothetical protein